MFLARKITRAKWKAAQGLSAGEIPADAVTVDLKTQGNSLSFWRCGTDGVGDVEKAALAIASAGDRVDRLDIVWLADEDLQADGQTLRDTKGRTPVANMADMHVEVEALDYVRLGKVARRILAAIEEGGWRRFTKARVRSLIQEAVGQDRVDLDFLHDKVRKEVSN